MNMRLLVSIAVTAAGVALSGCATEQSFYDLPNKAKADVSTILAANNTSIAANSPPGFMLLGIDDHQISGFSPLLKAAVLPGRHNFSFGPNRYFPKGEFRRPAQILYIVSAETKADYTYKVIPKHGFTESEFDVNNSAVCLVGAQNGQADFKEVACADQATVNYLGK
ncbi:hypothetical protein [Duganella sp. S19_KUP01_CR8]|uniref:hypothetical protein n=1 Tax=Duganella sp. S19_KUP01_CR8 TaxID=3025502 RepID=UPI002FCDA017